jgi:2-polyprenyl-3-methyl-5-hydroxy-6-metoxy-1,4-benzoquinol methylase
MWLLNYPKYLFYKFIKKHIPSTAEQIVDAPCGVGYITHFLSKSFPNTLFYGIDIDEESIKEAQRDWSGKNITYYQNDIYTFSFTEDYDIFLLINSLFLLPEPKKLMAKIKENLKPGGSVIVIVPNIHSDNFKSFQRAHPGENTFIKDRNEMILFFKEAGYTVEKTEGLIYVPYVGINRKWLWIFKGSYPFVFDKVYKWLSSKPSYWGFIIKKS